MSVSIKEYEEFMQVLIDQNMEKIEDNNLKKAIRHFWDIGSEATVNSRINTLESEDWITQEKHSDTWIVNHDRTEGIEKLFKEDYNNE